MCLPGGCLGLIVVPTSLCGGLIHTSKAGGVRIVSQGIDPTWAGSVLIAIQRQYPEANKDRKGLTPVAPLQAAQ